MESVRALAAIDIVEEAYRLDGTEAEWLALVLARARADLDTGYGVYAFTSQGTAPNIRTSQVFVQHELDHAFADRLADLDRQGADAAYARIHERLVSCGGLEQFFGAGSGLLATYRGLMTPISIKDGFFLFAQDAEGGSVTFSAPSSSVVQPAPRVRGIWSRIGLHVASALRLRRKLLEHDAACDALLDPRGKVQHASEAVKDNTFAKGVLVRAVRAMEQARSVNVRSSPEQALSMWQGLVAGEWSLVEHWESGGRRYIAAYRNRPEVRDPRAFTPKERTILEHLALGASNKEIGYALGLPAGTVTNAVARIVRKLGLRSRVDVAALFGRARLDRFDVPVPGAELGVVSVDVRPGKHVARALSAAELDIASCVAHGWSNRRIAEARRVSPSTVANQLRMIYEKLDLTSRSQLAATLADGRDLRP